MGVGFTLSGDTEAKQTAIMMKHLCAISAGLTVCVLLSAGLTFKTSAQTRGQYVPSIDMTNPNTSLPTDNSASSSSGVNSRTHQPDNDFQDLQRPETPFTDGKRFLGRKPQFRNGT
jgi:hypothetical protein